MALAVVTAPRAGVAQPTPAANPSGTAWQLVRFQGGDEKVRTPDDRSKYTIDFGPDGRLAVRFDCNRGAGGWKSTGTSQIEFGPLALTRAMCPRGSMHDQLVKHWPFVRSYVVRERHLFLSLMADGGIYEFEPRDAGTPVGAPAGTSVGTSAGTSAGTSVRFVCGTSEVTTRVTGDSIELTIGGKSFTLAQAKAASGARYVSPGPPEVSFWNKGKVATLTIGKTKYPECHRLDAD